MYQAMAYLFFFNPVRFLVALAFPKTTIPLADAETSPPNERQPKPSLWQRIRRHASRKARAHLADAGVQAFGMWALAHTLPRMLTWCRHLMRGRIERHTRAPDSRIPMRNPEGGRASHALPSTPCPLSSAPASQPDLKKAA